MLVRFEGSWGFVSGALRIEELEVSHVAVPSGFEVESMFHGGRTVDSSQFNTPMNSYNMQAAYILRPP